MIVMIATGVAAILLALLLYIIPLEITLKGKGVIWATSVLIGLLGIVSKNILPLWQVILYPFLLSILFTYFITKKLEIHQEKETSRFVEDLTPAYSFAEQVEKAKLAETLEDYYVTVKAPSMKEKEFVSSPEQVEVEAVQTKDFQIDDPKEQILAAMEEVASTVSTYQEMEEVAAFVPVHQEKGEDSLIAPDFQEIESIASIIPTHPELEEIDFDARESHLIYEPIQNPVEQMVASSLETDEEMLIENRRRLFEGFDEKSVETSDFDDVIGQTDDRKMIEDTGDFTRVEELEDMSDFSSIRETEDVHDFAKVKEVEDISNFTRIEELEDISDFERKEEPEELSLKAITEEKLAESKRKMAFERREKQQIYQDKVQAQFEDLEEIYLRKKGEISNEEEL